MKIFDIYRYKNPHKGYGYGEHVEYFVLRDAELEEAYDNAGILENPSGETIATRAGYDSYDYTAREVDEEELREEIRKAEERIEDAKSALDESHKGNGRPPHDYDDPVNAAEGIGR